MDSQTTDVEGQNASTLAELLRVAWRRLWIVVLAAILLAGGVIGYDLGRTPVYEVSIKILVKQQQPSDTPDELLMPGGMEGELQGLQLVTQTLVEALQTRPIAQEVIYRQDLQMDPEELLRNLDVEQLRASQFIQVTYRDTDAQRAQLIANTVGDVLSDQAPEISPSVFPLTVKVFERAEVPGDPISPNPLRDGLVALVSGVMLGVALAFLLEHLEGGKRSSKGTEQNVGMTKASFGNIVSELQASRGKAPRSEEGRS